MALSWRPIAFPTPGLPWVQSEDKRKTLTKLKNTTMDVRGLYRFELGTYYNNVFNNKLDDVKGNTVNVFDVNEIEVAGNNNRVNITNGTDVKVYGNGNHLNFNGLTSLVRYEQRSVTTNGRPSVDGFYQADPTVTILGNNQTVSGRTGDNNDLVRFEAHGARTEGTLKLEGGNDIVSVDDYSSYSQRPYGKLSNINLNIDLGTGDDSMGIGYYTLPRDSYFEVNGGEGKDTLRLMGKRAEYDINRDDSGTIHFYHRGTNTSIVASNFERYEFYESYSSGLTEAYDVVSQSRNMPTRGESPTGGAVDPLTIPPPSTSTPGNGRVVETNSDQPARSLEVTTINTTDEQSESHTENIDAANNPDSGKGSLEEIIPAVEDNGVGLESLRNNLEVLPQESLVT